MASPNLNAVIKRLESKKEKCLDKIEKEKQAIAEIDADLSKYQKIQKKEEQLMLERKRLDEEIKNLINPRKEDTNGQEQE